MKQTRYIVQRLQEVDVAYMTKPRSQYVHLFTTEWDTDYNLREALELKEKFPTPAYNVIEETRTIKYTTTNISL